MTNDNTAFADNLAMLRERIYAELSSIDYGESPAIKQLLEQTIVSLAKEVTRCDELSRCIQDVNNESLILQQQAVDLRASLSASEVTIAELRADIEAAKVIRIQHQAPNAQLARAKTLVVRDMLQRRADAASYRKGTAIQWHDADYDEEAMYERMVKLVVDDDDADDVWSLTRTYEADVVLTVKVRMSVTATSSSQAEELLSDTMYHISLHTPYASSDLNMESEVQDVDVDSVEIDER